eukprot:jgi/Phyca11/15199/fgenesh1_pg.PHYCAscaffold_12_\
MRLSNCPINIIFVRTETFVHHESCRIEVPKYRGSNYLKPGCTIRGGKQGVDFFNGEDALLAHVKADKDLCTRLNLTNIMVRPNAVPLEPLPASISSAPSTSGKRQDPTDRKQPPKKRSKTAEACKSAYKKSEDMQTPNTKKKTKKQEAKEATERRRQLSSFTNIWGDANAEDRDGRQVEAPNKPPAEQENHTNADTEVNPVMAQKANTKTTQTLLNLKGMMNTKTWHRI